ncbi:N-acetylneuraminate synthase [Helicobacter pullorum]
MDKVFIIAEAGVNHNGNIEIAKRLIEIASEAGADAVKFQTFKTENCITSYAPKANYQIQTTGQSENQYEMVKKLELDIKSHRILMDYCKQKNIMFLSTAFDLDSVDLLDELGLEIFKIPSGEITNLPYLRKIAKLNKKIILSTGMANLGEIENAVNILVENGTKREKVTVLHCNTEYPTPICDVNLKAMLTIKEAFKVPVGYSDHTLGINIPLAAVTMGAEVIEKHITLDKNMDGPDHRASLEPHELKEMVVAIREIEKALGDGIKKTMKSEEDNKLLGRKSIVAITPIKKGEILSEVNLGVKRPGNGISPMEWDRVIGSKAIRDFQIDEQIEV